MYVEPGTALFFFVALVLAMPTLSFLPLLVPLPAPDTGVLAAKHGLETLFLTFLDPREVQMRRFSSVL